MAPIVAANAIRVSVNGTYGGHPFANVFGGLITGGGAAEGLAFDIAQSYLTNVLPFLQDDVHVDGFTWIDLRSTSGDSGPLSGSFTGPFDGGQSEAGSPSNVAYLTHWQVSGGRNTRNGRSYLPGVLEAAVDNAGVLSGSNVEDLADGLLTFLQDVTEGDNGDVGVLSNPADGTPTMRSIVTGTLDPVVATQRRRLRP